MITHQGILGLLGKLQPIKINTPSELNATQYIMMLERQNSVFLVQHTHDIYVEWQILNVYIYIKENIYFER